MEWKKLNSIELVNDAIKQSDQSIVLLFKHSYRCPISATVLKKLEKAWVKAQPDILPFFIDVIDDRVIALEVAEKTAIAHQSPQAIVLSCQKVVHHASHYNIELEKIMADIES